MATFRTWNKDWSRLSAKTCQEKFVDRTHTRKGEIVKEICQEKFVVCMERNSGTVSTTHTTYYEDVFALLACSMLANCRQLVYQPQAAQSRNSL